MKNKKEKLLARVCSIWVTSLFLIINKKESNREREREREREGEGEIWNDMVMYLYRYGEKITSKG